MFKLIAGEGRSSEWQVTEGRRPGLGTNFDVYAEIKGSPWQAEDELDEVRVFQKLSHNCVGKSWSEDQRECGGIIQGLRSQSRFTKQVAQVGAGDGADGRNG